MKIDILTLFPEMFKGPFDESIIKRAQKKRLLKIKIHNLRKWANDKRGTVDDRPFGGGVGMILMIKPIYDALQEVKTPHFVPLSGTTRDKQNSKVILLSPKGKVFNQEIAKKLSKLDHIIFICGHYEGIDERVREHLVDEEISIGDYVLTGGELPTMVVIDSITRLIPGVLEKPEAIKSESFSCSNDLFRASARNKVLEQSERFLNHDNKRGLLEYPQYTRPANFKGWGVPEVLLSGNHQKITTWREKKALEVTKKRRPDLV